MPILARDCDAVASVWYAPNRLLYSVHVVLQILKVCHDSTMLAGNEHWVGFDCQNWSVAQEGEVSPVERIGLASFEVEMCQRKGATRPRGEEYIDGYNWVGCLSRVVRWSKRRYLQPNLATSLVERLGVVPNAAIDSTQSGVEHLQVSYSSCATTCDVHVTCKGLDREHVQMESPECAGKNLRTRAIVGARIKDTCLCSGGR